MKLLVLALAAATALSACNPQLTERDALTGKTFYCEDDGELVEQHVGVDDYQLHGEMWTLHYNDGETGVYRQPEGETCQIVNTTIVIE